MKFCIEIESDNDALTNEDGELELVRIIRDVADRVCHHERGGTCRDLNGNGVGRWTLEIE
jgi:hypothetical protein